MSLQNTRNFAIIAHIDHGKSTLADRLLEITHTITPRQMQSQMLDSNPIERERGITIKLAPVRMHYTLNSQTYVLNLIDTPGHVDFSYEVNRSLAACEGAILLVDATQGIQAQTMAHFQLAKQLGLIIIPVINKIDVISADIAGSITQLQEVFNFKPNEIVQVSGKTGQNVDTLLAEIIARVPAPIGNLNAPLRALIFNSNFDVHLGVVAWIRVIDGQISPNQNFYLLSSGISVSVIETGVFTPTPKNCPLLQAGEVGFVVTGLRDISQLQVGDTLGANPNLTPLLGYRPAKPVVFISFYPSDGDEINILRDALNKLKLADSSIEFTSEFSPALGNGFRVGLLGLLHADIVQERLEREFGVSLIAAAPSVGFEVLTNSGDLLHISKAQDLPDISSIKEIREPVINLSIFVPEDYVGSVMQLCQKHRGILTNMRFLGNISQISYTLPLIELIRHFYDELKSVSQGFATLDYELDGYVASALSKLDILINGEKIDALSQITPKNDIHSNARSLVEKLQNIIPRQQFEVVIQAVVGSSVLARAEVKAYRKDVTARLYGGDQTRKDKLLKKQKKGKKRMKRFGKIDLPQEVFLSILKM